MTIDRRLHHAARELRAVPIEVPPLGASTRRRQPTRVLHALAAPMLFVAGGLFALGAARTTGVEPTQSDIPGVTAVSVLDQPASATLGGGEMVTAPSVRAELQMIAEIVANGRLPEAVTQIGMSAAELPTDPGSTASSGPI